MATLASPRNVSPFIRFCRWSLLLTGVTYGHFHLKHLEKKETKIQAYEDKIREKRDARLAIEREHKLKDEMDMLAKETGTPLQ